MQISFFWLLAYKHLQCYQTWTKNHTTQRFDFMGSLMSSLSVISVHKYCSFTTRFSLLFILSSFRPSKEASRGPQGHASVSPFLSTLLWVLFTLCLSPQPRERGRMRFHKLQNVQIALDFLRHRQVREQPNLQTKRMLLSKNYSCSYSTLFVTKGDI